MKIINTENFFQSWGKSNQQLPDNNSVLKNIILSKHQSTSLTPVYQKNPLPWLSMSFATLAILIFLAPLIQMNKLSYPTTVPATDSPYSNLTSFEKSRKVQSNNMGIGKEFYPNYPTTPISDNREFIKINYNATIKTRHVEELTNRVQVVIRGLEGRVDRSNSSHNYGYINFVVPASKFDSFKTEIKNIVGSRFYLEQINTQNLLPEKQTIEQQQTDTQKTIDSLRVKRRQLITNHNNTLNSLRASQNLVIEEIEILKSEVTTDQTRQAEIQVRLSQLADKSNVLNFQITTENKNYQSNLSMSDKQIKAYEFELENIKKQDRSLLDNMATINGTISLNRISVWGIVNLYLPGHWTAWALIVMSVTTYFVHNRKYQIVIP